MVIGTVLGTGGGIYRVALDDGERVEASLRGRLKLEERTGDKVVIGDRVRVNESEEGVCTIEEVLPRDREVVRRRVGGRRPKVVAANVDRLLVVVAAAEPDPRRESIDRLLVVAAANRVEAVLVINKVDLEDGGVRASGLAATYRDIGYTVVRTSTRSGEGLPELRALLCDGISALVGPSGAGKSSLLNAVEPGLRLRIGAVSRGSGRGRHTTVSGRLVELGCGGRVADTPGFSDVGLWGVEPEELDFCFPEFRDYLGGCRFRGCSHLHEPGCAVKTAVEAGAVDRERYQSYGRLRADAEEGAAPPWR